MEEMKQRRVMEERAKLFELFTTWESLGTLVQGVVKGNGIANH